MAERVPADDSGTVLPGGLGQLQELWSGQAAQELEPLRGQVSVGLPEGVHSLQAQESNTAAGLLCNQLTPTIRQHT